jgi:hypothetical protein
MLTDEQRQILEKFGFRLDGSTVKHRKLGIVKEREAFESFASMEDLEAFVKSLLRSQCPAGRARRDHG